MALTVTVNKSGVAGDLRYAIADVAFDSSYPTNGEALSAGDLGYPGGTVQVLHAAPDGGYVFEYNHTAGKLVAYYGDNNNASDGPLIEVPNATDLSARTSRVLAYITGV